jgi:RNA polymerase sigma-70 factor, ECF subfamily
MATYVHFANMMGEHLCGCQAYYGNVEISRDIFTGYVWDIVSRHFSDSSDVSALTAFARELYLNDLYLACGCVYNSEGAWTAFDARYRRLITNLVRFCHRHGTDNEEIADLILVSLYFRDRSGRQRIASYDGRSSLATWLRVIVVNHAINERNRRKLPVEECVADIPDARALAHFESALRARRYGNALSDSLTGALRQLKSADRLMLIWRYEDNMPLGDMAHLLGIHQSNVTRRLVRVQARLRESVIENLASQHKLSPAAIQECLIDVIENPFISVSLMSIVKESPQMAAASP